MKKQKDKKVCPHCSEGAEEVFETKEEPVEHIANAFLTQVFEDYWRDRKEDLKALSKKDMARKVFFEAIAEFVHNTLPDELPEKDDP